MNPWALFLVAGGLFAICGAAFNWAWFMNNPKARLFILGRTGARIFYGLLGAALVVVGMFFVAGIVAMCVTLVVAGILALQWWVAWTTKGDLFDRHVWKFPPDGGG